MILPDGLKDILRKRIPVRVLCLDLMIQPDVFHFATRKIKIGQDEYAPFLVQSGEYAAFGGAPADRIRLQVQNIDKAMSAFFHSNILESAPAEVFWWFPEVEFKWILIKGRVSLITLSGQVAEFEVRSRLDPASARFPRRQGQALCPWATMGLFDDGPVSDPEAQCPYRSEGVPGFSSCPGRLTDCQARGMFDPQRSKWYFAGMPIQSAVRSEIRESPLPEGAWEWLVIPPSPDPIVQIMRARTGWDVVLQDVSKVYG